MMSLHALSVVGAGLLAVPATVTAQPTRFQLDTTLAPGQQTALTVGQVPRGLFVYSIRTSSDGEQRFGITQQRLGVFHHMVQPVLNVPSPLATTACQGAAGTLLCRGISKPAWIDMSTYTFRVRNKGNRPLRITLAVRWRPIAVAR
jgi:hypothetical protein